MQWIRRLCAWIVRNFRSDVGTQTQEACRKREWQRAFMRDA